MEISKLEYYPLEYHDDPKGLQDIIIARSREFLKATMFCREGASQTFKYEGRAFVARRKNIFSKRDEEDVSNHVLCFFFLQSMNSPWIL